MAGRKADPKTRYKVHIHKDKKYRYAAVQDTYTDPKTGKNKYKIMHLGTRSEEDVFIPNADFRLMPAEERSKFVFPSKWDITAISRIYSCSYLRWMSSFITIEFSFSIMIYKFMIIYRIIRRTIKSIPYMIIYECSKIDIK